MRLRGLKDDFKRFELRALEKQENDKRLLTERLETLVRDRLQQRLELAQKETKLMHDRMSRKIQELLRQELEKDPKKQLPQQLVRQEIERAMQLAFAEISIPLLLDSAPFVMDSDVEQLVPANTRRYDQSNDCLVCYDAVRDAVCVPCGHLVLCVECARLLKGTTSKCLLCSASIESVMKVFHA